MHEQIKLGMSKAAHGCAWADTEEEYGYSLSGCEILSVMDPVTEEATAWAEELCSEILKRNPGVNLEAIANGEDETLGHYLAMEAMGHGVSWEDSREPHGLSVPDREFYYFSRSDYGAEDVRADA